MTRSNNPLAACGGVSPSARGEWPILPLAKGETPPEAARGLLLLGSCSLLLHELC